jgi:digeranylgeranylglycerophospholipid reductase
MISIVGSGTIGSYAAYLLAKQGEDVKLFEEHEKVGIPCHCTGIVTSYLQDMIKLPKKLVVNKLKHVKVVAPNGKSIVLGSKDIVLDRIGFDVFLAEKAVKEGAEVVYGHRFEEIKNNDLIFKNKDEIKKIKTDIIVGADGPDSRIRKYVYDRPISKWIGVQTVQKAEYEKDTFEVYFGNDLCPEFFAWVVPESEDSAIVGLAAKKTPNIFFERFMKMRFGENYKQGITSWRGGMIPEYDSKINTQKDNIYLVGDAATHVKATTGGGIIPGMKAAEALADSIKNKKDYDSEWRKRTGKDLWLHLKMRQTLNKFSDKDYNYLIKLMDQERISSMLSKHEREYPSQFMARLVLKEPRLLYFMKHLF